MSDSQTPNTSATPIPDKAKELARLKVAASLWRRCELDWKLEPHQLKAYQKIKAVWKSGKNTRFVLNASRRWGKTFLLCVLAVEFALANPGSTIIYAGSTQKQVKDFILPTFRTIFKDCPPDLEPKFKTQSNQVVFPNATTIKLTGLDGGRVEKIRGLTAHLELLDEAGFVDDLAHAVRSVLFPMTTTTGGHMVLSSNAPLTPGHDFVRIFAREAEELGQYLIQTIFDVTKYTKDDFDRFARESGGYDSAAFQREYMCKFVQDETNAVIPEFSRFREKVELAVEQPAFFYPLVSIDLGLIDFTAALFGYWDFEKGRGVIEDELLLKGTNSENLVKECRNKELCLWGEAPSKPITRVADGQAYTLNDIVTVHKYPVGAVSKDNVEAQANAIRLDIQSGRLVINPKCVKLLGQLEDATWNKTRTEFSRDVNNGHFDLLAALQYWVRHVNRYSNPFPPHYRLDVRNMIIKNSKLNNPSLQALQKLLAPKT